MDNPVSWFVIHVEDMARARAFYESLLQVRLEQPGVPGIEMWAFPMRDDGYGSGGALVRMPGVSPGGNSVLVYFRCDDCAVEAGRAVTAGGKMFKEKFSIGKFGYIALVNDTENNLIGLHSLR